MGEKKKTIILRWDGENVSLLSKMKLKKGTEGFYNLCFVGIDRKKTHLAQIESISMKEYVVIDQKGYCDLPDCFNICSEILIRLVTMEGDTKSISNSVFLKLE